MKKLLLLIPTVVFLTACNNNNTSNTNIQQPSPSVNSSNQTEAEQITGTEGNGISTTWNADSIESWDSFITDCSKDENTKINKNVMIKLADIKDSKKYAEKREEAIDLINQCYTVKVQEEYAISGTESSTQEGIFTRKIIDTDQIFDKLLFYPNMNLYDYESFMWNWWLKYITTDSKESILSFYKDMQINGYKIVESKDWQDNNSLTWKSDKWSSSLTLNIIPQEDWKNIIEYSFNQSFDMK
mgnify:CR=1 FL=1